MGYHTQYSLDYECEDEIDAQICEYINGHADLRFALGRDNQGGEPTTWHKHEDDMRILSRQFPDVRFCLEGKGDDTEDWWREHYIGGKMGREEPEFVWPTDNGEELEMS